VSLSYAGGTTADSATVVLTNALAGDALSIAGVLPGGIGSSIDSSIAGQITLSLFGSASLTSYQTALGAVRFANSSDNPTTADRDITMFVSAGEAFSNVAHAAVHVIAVNDPPVITSNGGGDAASVSIPENTTAVTTVAASDPDSSSLSHAIAGGGDAAKFQINAASGALSFIAAPDFEIPGDSDHNNSYIVQVRASDGSLADTQTITVSVTNVNDPVPTVHWTKSIDVGPHPAGWLPAGIGDFNNDATSDVAWFNATSGDVDIWKLSNGQSAGGRAASMSARTRPAMRRRSREISTATARPTSPGTIRRPAMSISGNSRTASGPAASASGRILPAGSRSGLRTSTSMGPPTSSGTIPQTTTSISG